MQVRIAGTVQVRVRVRAFHRRLTPVRQLHLRHVPVLVLRLRRVLRDRRAESNILRCNRPANVLVVG